MKRMLMALAAVAGLAAAAGSARADWGQSNAPVSPQAGGGPSFTPAGFNAPGTLMGAGAPVPGKSPDRYGLLPALRKPFRAEGSCSSCGHGGRTGPVCGPRGSGHLAGPGYSAQPQYPPVQQGTLVFPNHTYVRSPRDFFMYEPGR